MAKHSDIEEATAVEIQRQIAAFSARRVEITNARAEIFKARGFGAANANVNEHANAIRDRARSLLNGHASLIGDVPAAVDDESLALEQSAIDHILAILGRKETQQRAVEAQEWAVDHEAEIRALYKEIFLAACKLRALRAKADDVAERAAGVMIPFGEFFRDFDRPLGVDGALLSLNSGQFETAAREAVACGLATESEIKKAMRP